VATPRRPACCLHSAGMTALVSSLILIAVFAAVAASGTGLVVALYRVTARKQAE
jgi:NADH:ubiquinone oxidoreductase subunit K